MPTFHAATVLLDRVLQQVCTHKSRLQLVAMSCLLVAAKYEEAEEDAPTPRQLCRQAMDTYDTRLVH